MPLTDFWRQQLTGGDTISARQLYGQQQNFTVNATLFLCTNDLPRFSDNSLGTWRRVRMLDMVARFAKEPKHSFERRIDPDLDAKVRAVKGSGQADAHACFRR